MELRLNEPDFLLRVVQMIRSLKRKRERSFFPPTVFYRERKERGVVNIILYCSKHLFNFTKECVYCQLSKYVLPPPWPFPVLRTSSVGSGSNTHIKRRVITTSYSEAQMLHRYSDEYLTCSTPSMCASISWMTLASLSASSAEWRPLLILSASRLMSLWASSRYKWSGWSSGVCLSRSLNKQGKRLYQSAFMWASCHLM